MNRTAAKFYAAGLTVRASAIYSADTAWLCANRRRIEHWASEFGLDVSDDLDADTGVFKPALPSSNVECEIVVPFCQADAPFVVECLQSLAYQNYVRLTIHVVSDGAEWPDIPTFSDVRLVRYQTPGGWGPYEITNAVFRYCTAENFAIMDGDDIAYPNRLWKQFETLRHFKADVISSALEVFIDEGSKSDPDLIGRLRYEPICRPGKRFENINPRGRTVNSMRSMTRSLFADMNGFPKIYCTGDFLHDNCLNFSGANVIHDQEIKGKRRLHSGSLTGGPFKLGSDARNRDTARTIEVAKAMAAEPTREKARTFGGLNQAREIERL